MNPYEAIIDVLKANSIDFEELEHEPVFTSEQAAKVRGLSLESGAKSLLLKADYSFYLVVLPGSKKIDSRKFKDVFGIKKFRFATPEEVKNIMHCEIGACYPLGSIANLDTYLDNSLVIQTNVSFNPGRHDRSIRMRIEDYMMLENPTKIDVSKD